MRALEKAEWMRGVRKEKSLRCLLSGLLEFTSDPNRLILRFSKFDGHRIFGPLERCFFSRAGFRQGIRGCHVASVSDSVHSRFDTRNASRYAFATAQGWVGVAIMEGFEVNGQHRVLIVDPSEETREVLRTMLERRGVTATTASRLPGKTALAQDPRPDLIVLDMESIDAQNNVKTTQLAYSSCSEQPQLLLLGTYRRQKDSFPSGEFVSKPYQYGSLIRKIEELIGESGTCRHCSSSAGPTKGPALS
jgi:CheY-like chemotaxis protein